ncbi:hypothetical protein [Fibrella forsythiae]|uniref:Uncharacterized protein n=1 Tax=Fibrella forsythiae TaxID=2817061 RepID=A0ABS3JNM7_9BACT|nr:hypothetical protein [Fibrella forsythiae]MBO0951585.1 hypothetical protein [Fibrella forsythiae]
MNKLTEHQNIYGQKIGVKYYVEKGLKSRRLYYGDKILEGYPLYIRITVKRQSAQIKSVIEHYVPPEKLDEFLQKAPIKPLIQDETNEIKRRILAFKPFDNESFKIAIALQGFSVEKYDIRYIIGSYLIQEYHEARSLDLLGWFCDEYDQYPTRQWLNTAYKIDDTEFNPIDRVARLTFSTREAIHDSLTGILPLSVYNRIRADAVKGSYVEDLVKRYGLPLLRLNQYLENFAVRARRLPTLSLFLSSEFDNLFIEYCDNEEVLFSVRQGFKALCERYGVLNELVENVAY